ncbi:MAG: hypothetical protein IH991_24600 [Planctomycetes bacterium]|nr:hypothetical protein [Planctomycetota bacterium]
MYKFDITVYAQPGDAIQGKPVELDGVLVTPLRIPLGSLQSPLAVTFEEAAETLQRLRRLFFEPDGSFVWVSAEGQKHWQVDGGLYDMGKRLMYATLKGSCPQKEFDQILQALGGADGELVFQVRQGVLLDAREFEHFAEQQAIG